MLAELVYRLASLLELLIYWCVGAAAVVSLFPKFFQRLGRKYTMMIGAFCFLVGAILQASPLLVYSICRQINL